jgi:hypothetical protein
LQHDRSSSNLFLFCISFVNPPGSHHNPYLLLLFCCTKSPNFCCWLFDLFIVLSLRTL